MKDGKGRTIDYLRLSVTDRCNYRCRYCMDEAGAEKKNRSEILSIEELSEIGRAAVSLGVTKIRLTGGEPLLRPGILELCRNLRALEGLRELAVTTNGSLLPELARPLREAGVDRLNISLDTLREDRFTALTRRGSLKEVLSGLEAAEAAGFSRLKLNTVLIGGFNEDEIANLAALTLERPWSVRFIELMPMGVCAAFPESCFVPGEAVLETLPELESAGRDGVAECYRLPGAKGTVGLIRPLSHKFCDRCSRLRVTADGRVKPCLHTAEELPIRGLRGGALERALREAAARKPAGHCLETLRRSAAARDMNEIGG